MTASQFRVSAKAKRDLLGIGRHTEMKWGRRQRNTYLRQLDQAFQSLAENPEIGNGCDHILEGYRKLQQGSHVIYYKAGEVIEIIRVLHYRMDPDSRLP